MAKLKAEKLIKDSSEPKRTGGVKGKPRPTKITNELKKKFAIEYVKHFNAAKAAESLGIYKDNYNAYGWKLKNDPQTQVYIKSLCDFKADNNNDIQDIKVMEKTILYADPIEMLYDTKTLPDGTIEHTPRHPKDLPEEARRMIKKMKYDPKNEVWEYEFYSRENALKRMEDIMQMSIDKDKLKKEDNHFQHELINIFNSCKNKKWQVSVEDIEKEDSDAVPE